MTLSILLEKKAKELRGKTCIGFQKRRFSYAQINYAVSLLAGGLKRIGLDIGDRAAILMDNCPEYIISYFGILRAGGITIPLNTFLTPREISYILRDSECKILIYGMRFLPYVEEIKRDIPNITAVEFSAIPRHGVEPYKGDEDDIAVILYTSGTTGLPKGAMLTHGNLISNAEACSKVMQIFPRDKMLLFLPLFHSFSFTVGVILSIYCGITISLLPSIRPFSRVINTILKERVTLFFAIPMVYSILVRKRLPFFLKHMFRFLMNIRVCVSGAAPLPGDTLHAFERRFKIPLLEGYGLTEASPVVSVNPLNGRRKPGSVGLPLPGVEVAVVGENGNRLATGEIGELIVRGPNIMKGYFNKERETREVLKDGWLYTGDMAKIDEDGYIYIVDRKKDLIIVDGMNIYPREIEDILLRHPSIEECAMIGIPDKRGSEIPILFVKKRENLNIDDSEIRNYLKGKIAGFKMPRKIRIIEEFPKTATGKIKKTVLKNENNYI
jgi:long-chain acyl-CoA synthetase